MIMKNFKSENHKLSARSEFIPKDTTLEAFHYQIGILRCLGPEARLEMALELTHNLRELVATGVRSRHPNHNEDQVRLAVTRLMAGEKVFRRLLPDVEVDP